MKTFYKSSLYGLLIIIGIFIFSVMIANLSLFDEELNPEITAISQVSLQTNIEGNAYYAIMGITAVADENTTDAGLALIKRYQQNRSQGEDNLSNDDYKELLGGNDKLWLDKYNEYLGCKEHGCLKRLSEKIKALSINSPRLTLMLQRYNNIIRMPNFNNFNDITVGTPMPNYGIIIKLSQLKLALLNNQPSKTEFLSQIAIEFNFWTMLLANSEMLIDKMVANRALRNHLYYLSEFIQANEIPEQQLSLIISILKPLSKNELNISESFASESRTMFRQIDSIDSKNIDFMLLQANATKNTYYKYFTEPLTRLSQLSTEDFTKALQSKTSNKADSLLNFTPNSLYNYGGKSLVLENYCPKCWHYIARIHDLNNMINLVKAQLVLKATDKKDIQQAILNSETLNLYTNKAYDFDNNGNWLKFDCLETNAKCRIKLF